MSYNPDLDNRLQTVIADRPGFVRKKMFGGNMCCGVYRDFLIVRLSPEEAAKACAKTHAKPMDITGKPMKGWVMVHMDGLNDDDILRDWAEWATGFAQTLPNKEDLIVKLIMSDIMTVL